MEPKVRLQGYGYNPFCSHSSRCLEVLVWQYFEEAVCAPKVRLKRYGFKGFPSHSSRCSGGLFPQYSGVSPNLVDVSDTFYFFCSGEGKGQSEAPGGRRGGRVSIENPRRGGGFPRKGGNGPEGVCGEFGGGGGGAKFFFFYGPKFPPMQRCGTPRTPEARKIQSSTKVTKKWLLQSDPKSNPKTDFLTRNVTLKLLFSGQKGTFRVTFRATLSPFLVTFELLWIFRGFGCSGGCQ